MSGLRGIRRTSRAGAPRRVARLALRVSAAVLAGVAVHAVAAGTSSGAGEDAWRWALPSGFPEPRVPKANPMSAAKVELGRRLFYERRLSGNATQSCGSCHRQELAFTDGRARALGSTGESHPRNTQPLANVAYNATLTWANPALVTLERQMEVPLFGENPVEMGVTDANQARVLARISGDRAYRTRFAAAFPGRRRSVTWTTVIRAIAAFQRSIVSADSRYDRYLRGTTRLTDSEQRGLNLFMGERAECHHCHGSFIFSDQATYVSAPPEAPAFHNTGLYNLGGTGAFPEPNRGVFEVTGRRRDMGRFRAPSLRNVALTAPYMHDGSMATLEEVVDHYAAGGRVIADGPTAGDGRRNPFKDPLVSGIDLSAGDRADLVAFLRALTDRGLLRDPRLADPARSAR
jgi:cytochrome c peroxidase